VEALVGHLRKERFHRAELTPPPLFYSSHPNNYIDFALLRHGFEYLRRELTSVVPLPGKDVEVFSSFKSEARTATRKAQKLGVVIRESDDYEDFYQILRKNLRMRHNVNPTHTPEELLRLKALLPDEIRLFSAFLKGEQIAGVVLFLCNPRVMLAFYISHRQEYQEYRSVNLLFYHIMDWGRREGFRYLDFGTFTLNMEPNWGLGKFKETFGAKGLFRDSFFLDLSA
jgi:lipid II:glycine glycyltransferase (peptidoglycan interpeptide bridge formation enzyme)